MLLNKLQAPKGASGPYIQFTTQKMKDIKSDKTYVNSDGSYKTNPETG